MSKRLTENNERTLLTGKGIEKDIKKYIKFRDGKKTEFKTLCEIKSVLFKELFTYSVEDLDRLREACKLQTMVIDKVITGILPQITAISIAVFSLMATFEPAFWIIPVLAMFFMFIYSIFLCKDMLYRLSYYKIVNQIIDMVEQAKGDNFNAQLIEQHKTIETVEN